MATSGNGLVVTGAANGSAANALLVFTVANETFDVAKRFWINPTFVNSVSYFSLWPMHSTGGAVPATNDFFIINQVGVYEFGGPEANIQRVYCYTSGAIIFNWAVTDVSLAEE